MYPPLWRWKAAEILLVAEVVVEDDEVGNEFELEVTAAAAERPVDEPLIG